jgi:hypothetical protein
MPGVQHSTGRTSFAGALLALAVALLAWIEPVESTQSDPALTLIAAQALVEHRTLSLDPYRADPRLAYDLDHDYRVRRQGESLYYFAPGAQLLAAPFVLAANSLGLDMLRPGDEAATQNGVSGLLLAIDTWLLFALLRRLMAPRAALVVTAVSVLGSSLVSTLATALWGAGFALPLLLEALRIVVRHAVGATRSLALGRLAALVTLAFLCRPAAACILAALVAYLVLGRGGPTRRGLLLGLGALFAAGVVWTVAAPHVPTYYSLNKLRPQTPLAAGLYGTLLSPSRGLLVFSPFLLPVAWALLRGRAQRAPHERPLLLLCGTWLGTQVLLVSLKGNWWGGYSFGPRLLTEALPAAAALTALAWGRLAHRPRERALLALVYVLLGGVAGWIHVRQGLFNRATQTWNRAVEPGGERELVLDWRHPQFLATEASVRARDLDFQERRLQPLSPGESVAAISSKAVFRDFHPFEIGWRPTGAASSIGLRLEGFEQGALYALALRAHVPVERAARITLGGRVLGALNFTPSEPHTRSLPVSGDVLRGRLDLRLDVPGAARASRDDARIIGLALHGLRLVRVPEFGGRLRFDDEAGFAQGFGDLEHGARWTRDRQAELWLRLAPGWRARGPDCRFEFEAGANGRQTVDVALDGATLGRLGFDGTTARVESLPVPSARLRPGTLQRLALELPQARSLPGDPRRLGLRLVELRLTCR